MDDKSIAQFDAALVERRDEFTALYEEFGGPYDEGRADAYVQALSLLHIFSAGKYGVERPQAGA